MMLKRFFIGAVALLMLAGDACGSANSTARCGGPWAGGFHELLRRLHGVGGKGDGTSPNSLPSMLQTSPR